MGKWSVRNLCLSEEMLTRVLATKVYIPKITTVDQNGFTKVIYWLLLVINILKNKVLSSVNKVGCERGLIR